MKIDLVGGDADANDAQELIVRKQGDHGINKSLGAYAAALQNLHRTRRLGGFEQRDFLIIGRPQSKSQGMVLGLQVRQDMPFRVQDHGGDDLDVLHLAGVPVRHFLETLV